MPNRSISIGRDASWEEFIIPDKIQYGILTNNETGNRACAIQFIDENQSAQPRPVLLGRQGLIDMIAALQTKLGQVTMP